MLKDFFKDIKEGFRKLQVSEYIFLFTIISGMVLFFLYDKEKILIKELNEITKNKFEVYNFAKQYDKLKSELNILETSCKELIFNYNVLDTKDLIKTSNNLKTDEEYEKFIKEYNKFYNRLIYFQNFENKLQDIMKQCIVKDNKEILTSDYILDLLFEKNKNLLDTFKEGKEISCLNLYNIDEEEYHLLNKNDHFYSEENNSYYFIKQGNLKYLYDIRFCKSN